jgi:membrane associated rhomboid family serine protease
MLTACVSGVGPAPVPDDAVLLAKPVGRSPEPFYNRFVSAGGPELFVICKSCGSEVSPYITECPYCGNRLRKRAPKIDRDGRVAEKRRRRPPAPSLPRLRSDEIPGIRPDSRPYATILLVVLGLAGCLVWRTSLLDLSQLAIAGKPGSHWWRLFTAPFTYDNTGYAFATLVAIALYGWLLERRHGPVAVLLLFLIGGVGGVALTAALYAEPLALGGNGAALALLCAWVTVDLLAIRAGEDVEADLMGTAAIAAVVALMPLVVKDASWIADGVGILAGFAIGLPLARLRAR